jgi:hypothetical protein
MLIIQPTTRLSKVIGRMKEKKKCESTEGNNMKTAVINEHKIGLGEAGETM